VWKPTFILLSSSSQHTPVAAIAGGVVGGVVFLVLSGVVAFLIAKRYLRRRYGRARMTIWEDEADDGPSAVQDAGTAHNETDLPPPHYQHVFPYVTGETASTIGTAATAGAGDTVQPTRGPRSPKQSRHGALSSMLTRGTPLPPTQAVSASIITSHEEKYAMP
jgi:hypothetical protein